MAATILVGAAGIVERIVLWHAWTAVTDSDEAVVGLMARAFLHGEHLAFYWGQPYGGTPEVAPLAVVFKLFGTSLLTLRSISLILGVLSPLLAWRVGSRLFGPTGGWVAAAVLWLAPASMVAFSMREMLFYNSTVASGLAIFLLALRFIERPSRWIEPLAIGLLAGVGFWMSTNIFYFVVPAGIAILFAGRRALPNILLSIPTALLGAAPWIRYNVGHHFASVDEGRKFAQGSYAAHLGVFVRGIGLTVGLASGQGLGGLFRFVAVVFGLLLATVVVALVVGQLRRWLTQKTATPPLDALAAAFAPAWFAASPIAGTHVIPRYFFFAWPVAALLLGRLLREPRAALPGLMAILIVTFIGVNAEVGKDANIPTLRPVAAALYERHTTRAFSDYWVAYRLTFETNERIIVSPFAARRRPQYDAIVRTDPHPAWIFLRGAPDEAVVIKTAVARNIHLDAEVAGAFDVLFPATPLHPEDIALNRPIDGIGPQARK